MKKLCLVFLFCLFGTNSFAMVWPVLKVDCVPELDFFEVRLLRFEQIPNKGSFLDNSDSIGSSEYELLKEKYGIIHEYKFVRDVPRQWNDNSMIKECVISGKTYTIEISHSGTTIMKGKETIAKELFFSSAWNDWTIWHLTYNAKRQEFLVLGEFSFDLPVLHFSFSTKGGAVLDEGVIKEKAKFLQEEIVTEDGCWRRTPAFLAPVIDLEAGERSY